MIATTNFTCITSTSFLAPPTDIDRGLNHWGVPHPGKVYETICKLGRGQRQSAWRFVSTTSNTFWLFQMPLNLLLFPCFEGYQVPFYLKVISNGMSCFKLPSQPSIVRVSRSLEYCRPMPVKAKESYVESQPLQEVFMEGAVIFLLPPNRNGKELLSILAPVESYLVPARWVDSCSWASRTSSLIIDCHGSPSFPISFI